MEIIAAVIFLLVLCGAVYFVWGRIGKGRTDDEDFPGFENPLESYFVRKKKK